MEHTSEPVWGWQSQPLRMPERVKHVFGQGLLTDVTFRVGPKNASTWDTVEFKAHRLLLAMGSAVFERMFYGSVPETANVVVITDIDPEPFGLLLKYIYKDEMGPFDKGTAFGTLNAANKYGMPILAKASEDYLRVHVATDNCLAWFVQAKLYGESSLASFFLEKIDVWGASVLQSADFLQIDIGTLREILSRDTLTANEVDVCSAAMRWASHVCHERGMESSGLNQRSALEDALFLIRFPVMTPQEVAAGPDKCGLLLAEEVHQLFRFWNANEPLPTKFINRKRLENVHAARPRYIVEGFHRTHARARLNLAVF